MSVIIILFLFYTTQSHSFVSSEIPNPQLSEQEQNARNCMENQNTCPDTSSTQFEVRALLVKCDKPIQCENATTPHQTVVSNKAGYEQTQDNNHVKHCLKKMILTIKVKNKGITNCKNQYIVIDHVYDPITEKSQQLMIPYVLKIKQNGVLQSYGMKFEHVVNAAPNEKVVNKNNEGYKGCSTAETNPTCESVKYNNQVLPFSTGYCCPCKENEKHDASTMAESNLTNPHNRRSAIKSNKVPGYNKRNFEDYGFIGQDGRVQRHRNVENVARIVPDDDDHRKRFMSGFKDANKPRLMLEKSDSPKRPKNLHKRGGQDCDDTYTPPGANPTTYHDSTHCMEFSELWYSVYGLHQPFLEHSLSVQIYEKCENPNGNSYWAELTKENPLTVGTNANVASNDESTIFLHYSAEAEQEIVPAIKNLDKKLLIPEPIKNGNPNEYPELTGGAGEYLLVNSEQIDPSGKTCNVAGVGYEGFANQPNRCDESRGSCFQNQPKQLWEADHKLEKQGKKGCHFLKNFGVLPENPIRGSCENNNKTLSIFYTGTYTSILDLEFKVEGNYILRANSKASITEVYSDGTYIRKTTITVKVTNYGLVSSVFYVGLSDFPLDVPASFNNIVSKPALIAPQHQHVYTLEIECEVILDNFQGNVQVLNLEKKIIAVRQLRIHKNDRCICIWHCACACFIADKGLKCKSLTLEQYHAAGFQGGLPGALQVVQYTVLDDMISIMLYILLFLFLTLLLLGIVKAVAGIFVIEVGLWGLDIILGLPKRINQYFEEDLSHRSVEYDEFGWPIHPDTKKKVRNTALVTEICINIVFFVIYPFSLMYIIFKKLFLASYRLDDGLEPCKCKTNHLRKSSGFPPPEQDRHSSIPDEFRRHTSPPENQRSSVPENKRSSFNEKYRRHTSPDPPEASPPKPDGETRRPSFDPNDSKAETLPPSASTSAEEEQ